MSLGNKIFAYFFDIGHKFLQELPVDMCIESCIMLNFQNTQVLVNEQRRIIHVSCCMALPGMQISINAFIRIMSDCISH